MSDGGFFFFFKTKRLSSAPEALGGLAGNLGGRGAPACPGGLSLELRTWGVLHTLLLGMGNVAATLEKQSGRPLKGLDIGVPT